MKPIACALALLVAACSTASQSDFKQGLAPASQFDRDSAECELRGEENRTAGGYYGLIGMASYAESYDKVYDACMRAKGYERAR